MTDRGEAPSPAEVAEYVAEMVSQLAMMAQTAGFSQTSASLMRAQISALADLRIVQAAPNDAA